MLLTWPKTTVWKNFRPFEAFPRYPWWGCQSPAAARWCSCPGSPSPSAPSCWSLWSAPGSGCPSASTGTHTPSCSRPPSASAPQSDLHNSESRIWIPDIWDEEKEGDIGYRSILSAPLSQPGALKGQMPGQPGGCRPVWSPGNGETLVNNLPTQISNY